MPVVAVRRRRLRGLVILLGLLVVTAGTTAVGSGIVSEQPPPQSRVGSTPDPAPEPMAAETTPDAQPQPQPEPLDLQPGIAAATALAAQAGTNVGIAVLDRQSDRLWTNGPPATEPVWVASIAKLFIADNLLHRQQTGDLQLTLQDRQLLESALRLSDDGAADSLYYAYGTESMITEVATRYGLPNITPSNQAGEWELTSVSAVDLVTYLDAFIDTAVPTDVDFVLRQLRTSPEIASDGFDQYFGIPAALPGQAWGIKQAWMCCPRDTSYLNTSGVLGTDNRYTVAIFTQTPGGDLSRGLIDQIAMAVLPPDLLQRSTAPAG